MMPFNPGDAAPWFHARTKFNETYRFNSVGGFYILMCFLGSTTNANSRKVMEDLRAAAKRLDPRRCHVFFITADPRDNDVEGLKDDRVFTTFWDIDRQVSALYGAVDPKGDLTSPNLTYDTFTLLLDPRLRVIEALPIKNPETHVAQMLATLEAQPDLGAPTPATVQAPILVVPRIFSPALCTALINYYNETGSNDSGFMRERDGKTVEILDHSFKRRRDCLVKDEKLRNACHGAIQRRLLPQIERAFNFQVTRLERYLVACYDGEDKGFFQPHRDNTTKGTAHRKFAVTINLNAGEYEGGDLCFREYGRQLHRAPTGGAVVFACGLLHEATPVTKGTRYCFLPFLYDEAGADLRQENLQFLEHRPETLAAAGIKDNDGETAEDAAESEAASS